MLLMPGPILYKLLLVHQCHSTPCCRTQYANAGGSTGLATLIELLNSHLYYRSPAEGAYSEGFMNARLNQVQQTSLPLLRQSPRTRLSGST